MSQEEMNKRVEAYKKLIHGDITMKDIDDDGFIKKPQKVNDNIKLKELKGEAYWCNKCKDTHFHGTGKYKRHIKHCSS